MSLGESCESARCSSVHSSCHGQGARIEQVLSVRYGEHEIYHAASCTRYLKETHIQIHVIYPRSYIRNSYCMLIRSPIHTLHALPTLNRLRSITLQCLALPYITTLHCLTLPYMTYQYIPPHTITCQYLSVPCIALHAMTYTTYYLHTVTYST